jgi:hypothetical protein
MKQLLTWASALALGSAGYALAGMQGQGSGPEGKEIPEYEEKRPGGYNYKINEIDRDADRYISREEARVNRHLFEQFDRLDTNNDNKLGKSELAAFQARPWASASAETVEATVKEVVNNKDKYLGQRVSVRGKVEKIHSPQALQIRGESWLFSWLFAEELPVLIAQPFPYTPDRNVLKDATIRVTGTIQEYSAAEIERTLGQGLDPELKAEFEGKEKRTILVAESITLAPRE